MQEQQEEWRTILKWGAEEKRAAGTPSSLQTWRNGQSMVLVVTTSGKGLSTWISRVKVRNGKKTECSLTVIFE